jgi:hypothetical protein
MKRMLVVVGAVFAVLVVGVVAIVGTWVVRGTAAERAMEDFCGSIEVGITEAELLALIEADPDIGTQGAGPSNGGNGPQPTLERGEFICWCGTNFEAGELRSVNAVTCID